MNRRYIKEKIYKAIMIGCLAIVISSLFMIIGTTFLHGGTVLLEKPDIVINPPGPRYLLGGEGGFLHAILGSIYMVIPATICAAILAMGIALYLQSDYSSERFAEIIRILLDALWGTPSIVYGIFVFTILVYMTQRASLFAGIIALTLLELPIITRYTDEAVQMVPRQVKESTYSMGSTRWETAKVVARYALPGTTAGILIGLGRGIGDAASVIFTSGAGSTMPSGLFSTATVLPVMIFQQASSYYPSVREQAYAAACVLILVVLGLNVASRLITRYLSRYVPRGR